MLKAWEQLPKQMKTEEVRPYYEFLQKKQISLLIKRVFDVVVSGFMLLILIPVMLILSVCIAVDSKGPVFYRQQRVTQYGRVFRIYKFRTMVHNADKIGSGVTVSGDTRITRVGKLIRKVRLDELPQLFNILAGDRGIIGTTKKNIDFSRVVTVNPASL